jgi:hypothetical protein
MTSHLISLNTKRARHNNASGNKYIGLVWFMMFNATFNNISVILWQSVLLVEETRVSGENHRRGARH